MKKIILAVAMIAMTQTLLAQGVNFSKSKTWEAVLNQAKAENKFIFIDGYATWCVPCKMMDRDTYGDANIGRLMNEKFISVKIQTDKVDHDDDFVKNWYDEAQMLKIKYQMLSLPALIFISPDGELVYRSFGYQNKSQFENTVKFATSTDASVFRTQINDFRNAKLSYKELPRLVGKMRELLIEDSLANVMVRDYFDNYVGKLTSVKEILTKENAKFASANPGLVKSKDKFFVELKKLPFSKGDEVINWPGGSQSLLENMVKKEELYLKLYKNRQIVNSKPDWKKIEETIREKYPQIDAKKVIEQFGVYGSVFDREGFFYTTKDWKSLNHYFKNDVESALNREDWLGVNNVCWFYYFCPVDDRYSSQIALKWMNLMLEKAKNDTKVSADQLSGWMDTKASLLYKLGNRKKAIEIEQSAIAILRKDNLKNGRKNDAGCENFFKIIEQMKKGEKLGSGYSHIPVRYPADWKLLN
ncbi:thioredoxin family protein [Pedobacter paludis]|uniref:Thioredoxin domain-containing protein n=1 Tax=Pedobacter paludis TaxID=2203212 RepID=A0A317F577_9SPHI|nr:DUF255 domain-containing protein [Pedobacter paludis]PWS32646.1 hypothetical protein DF947_06125 [Pedobacter paludis]